MWYGNEGDFSFFVNVGNGVKYERLLWKKNNKIKYGKSP